MKVATTKIIFAQLLLLSLCCCLYIPIMKENAGQVPLKLAHTNSRLPSADRDVSTNDNDSKSYFPTFSAISNFLYIISKSIYNADKAARENIVIDSKLRTKFIVSHTIPRNNFNAWLEDQSRISFQGILNNIGGLGLTATDQVLSGIVIASPSKSKPDYFYQWTRDSALTVNSLVQYLDDKKFISEEDECIEISALQNGIENYILNSYHLQRLPNQSGKFDDENLDGLGEPKFLTDGEPFDQPWGRPQRDGPGLRAITTTAYLNLLSKYDKDIDNKTLLESPEFVYQEIIKPDLSYIIKNWGKNGFDLWEEIDSIHFFTSLTQLRALKDGISISNRFNDKDFADELSSTFEQLKKFIVHDSGFTQFGLSHVVETPSLFASNQRAGLDAATLLAAIHSHDADNLEFSSDIPFDVSNSYVINTLVAMVNDMKYRYPINHNRVNFSNGVGVAIGRYPEDIYDGVGTSEGNPWFISTATASELIYKLVYQLYKSNQDLIIDLENKDFYQLFIDSAIKTDLTLPYGSIAFQDITHSLIDYADSFLDVIRQHVDEEGHISEQFNKYTGYMEGAEDLTWSYSATWSSFRWRNRVLNLVKSYDFKLHN